MSKRTIWTSACVAKPTSSASCNWWLWYTSKRTIWTSACVAKPTSSASCSWWWLLYGHKSFVKKCHTATNEDNFLFRSRHVCFYFARIKIWIKSRGFISTRFAGTIFPMWKRDEISKPKRASLVLLHVNTYEHFPPCEHLWTLYSMWTPPMNTLLLKSKADHVHKMDSWE